MKKRNKNVDIQLFFVTYTVFNVKIQKLGRCASLLSEKKT